MKDILTQGFQEMGITPPGGAVDRLCRYSQLLLEQNQVMNLTAITQPDQVARLHFMDSAAILARPHGSLAGKSVIDVGDASLSKLWDDNMTLREFDSSQAGGSLYELGSYPLLPILKLLGTDYKNINLYSRMQNGVDMYTKGVMRYPHAICSFQVGLGVKTEGNLVISGKKGYAYVPAPWW